MRLRPELRPRLRPRASHDARLLNSSPRNCNVPWVDTRGMLRPRYADCRQVCFAGCVSTVRALWLTCGVQVIDCIRAAGLPVGPVASTAADTRLSGTSMIQLRPRYLGGLMFAAFSGRYGKHLLYLVFCWGVITIIEHDDSVNLAWVVRIRLVRTEC